MNRNLEIILLIITMSFGSLFGMEKPSSDKETKSPVSMAEIALKAADACYFGLDNQPKDFVKAVEFYKRVILNKQDLSNSGLASYMLTVMAFAGQGGLSSKEWQKYALQTNEFLAEIYKNNDLKDKFLTAGLLRFYRLLKITPEKIHIIIGEALLKPEEKMSKFFTYLQSRLLNEVNKIFILCKINKILKNKVRNPGAINFENNLLEKITRWIASLTEYFDWHIQFQKEVLVMEIPGLAEIIATIKKLENEYGMTAKIEDAQNAMKPLMTCLINLQQALKIEAEILKDVSLELVTNLASLFYYKKIKKEDAANALECLHVAAKAVRNDDYVRSISNNISNDPLIALKVIRSFYYKKAKWLNFERAQEYSKLANNHDSLVADTLIAVGEVYFHGLGIRPNYNEALDAFKAAFKIDNIKVQVRATLALGHMYFYGDIKNTDSDAAQPDYKLAEVYLRSAFDQNYLPSLKAPAAILLGHMYHYENEYGVATDLDEALKFYNFAANQFDNLPLQYRAQKEAKAIRYEKDLQLLNEID